MKKNVCHSPLIPDQSTILTVREQVAKAIYFDGEVFEKGTIGELSWSEGLPQRLKKFYDRADEIIPIVRADTLKMVKKHGEALMLLHYNLETWDLDRNTMEKNKWAVDKALTEIKRIYEALNNLAKGEKR